ncbi:hypothetical protein E2P81_ATG04756 [Venturia nashicola]|nr:hypothetical protein E2P81_ATG04756 [Venturia nashicola]
MCAPKNPNYAPSPIENLAANQETLNAILSHPITEPPRPLIQLIPMLCSFQVWIYPFPKLHPPFTHKEYLQLIGHICRHTHGGSDGQNDDRTCYNIAAAEEWPAITQLEEDNQFDVVLEYHVPDEATMEYIFSRLSEKYTSGEEGYKYVQLFDGKREFPAASGNFVDEPGVSIEIRRYTVIED